MLYKLLRFIFRITNSIYFKTLQVKGAENIPADGPVCFVANHPSAFMDPIVIASVSGRPLFFLAKGELFQNRFTRWLLPRFNMIPIFRSDETPDQVHKNKEVFSHCHRHFAKGGALLIFPEGISLTERKIKKIKTGTARICLGAEAENDFGLGIKIITIGLNFSNPHKFQSDLFVNIDQPIHVSDYRQLYNEDPFKAAHALTDEIRKRLENQVIAIQDAEVDQLVANIELIYKSQLLRDLGHTPGQMEGDFNTTRAISESVHHFTESEPLRVERMKADIASYFKDLERLSLNDTLISGFRKTSPVFDGVLAFFYMILGFPLFLFGVINNYLPYRIPGWLAGIISKRREFFGAIAFSIGTFTFIIFYAVQIGLVNHFTGNWAIVAAYVALLPVSGFFAFYYWRRFTTLRGNWKIFSLFYRKNRLVASLISKRQAIIDELVRGKEEFISYVKMRNEGSAHFVMKQEEDLNNFFNLNI